MPLKTPIITLLLLIGLSLSLYGQTVLTLQEQVERALSTFRAGDYVSCYWQFEAMETDYGTEPEFLTHNLQQMILPVRSYASLMADRPTDALVYFEKLLSHYNPEGGLLAFVLYNRAIAQSQTQALAAAAQSFNQFQRMFPDTNEAALALLQEANLRFEIGEIQQAETLLDTFYTSNASETLRMQARLRALQIASEAHSVERARTILFETDWNVTAMPDIAILSFAALEIGDLLLEEGHYKEAVRAYRLTLPHSVLIEKQRERLQMLEATLAQNRLFASSIWKSYYQQLIERLKRQLELLETMADYTPGLYLRSGQAYLLGQRYREAVILFRTVANSEDFEAEIRAEAHYRWILALSEACKWQDARDTAQRFLKEHPGHKLANSALFLVARAYQLEGQYIEAIGVLDDLIDHFPDDPQAPRWYFTRGYNFCALENYSAARGNFDTALERFPESNLIEQTRLWRGLSFFFERNYPESLKALNALLKESSGHPLYPEILFRIANIYYAQRDYENALSTIEALVDNFPNHYRTAEAYALRGDTFMGLGELDSAVQAFNKVPSDNTKLFDYAVFQTTKIHKALERYDLLREHLGNYIDREDSAERPRVSEALYWIGWSLQQEERGSEALPLFESALTRFGNDPKALAVGSILAAYSDSYKRLDRSNSSLNSFDRWLRDTTAKSLESGQLTWFARLTRFNAEQQRKTLGDHRADATLLSINRFVPLDQQDAETLAAVGLVLIRRGYLSADDYCEQLLVEHPDHFERGTAYFGKAQLAADAGQLKKAHRWLLRFLQETPTHPLVSNVRLLTADILIRQSLYADAREALEQILQLKSLRGRPHARALAGLARIETELGKPKRAIPYWQRIYTLYRAYPEMVMEAYWESALLFETIGELTAAHNTLTELIRDSRLAGSETYQRAQEKLSELEDYLLAQNQHNLQAAEEAQELETSQ
jgi:tetratricopeptide (TPR) repeat protein